MEENNIKWTEIENVITSVEKKIVGSLYILRGLIADEVLDSQEYRGVSEAIELLSKAYENVNEIEKITEQLYQAQVKEE